MNSSIQDIKSNREFEIASGMLLAAYISEDGNNKSNEMKVKVNIIVDVRVIRRQLCMNNHTSVFVES